MLTAVVVLPTPPFWLAVAEVVPMAGLESSALGGQKGSGERLRASHPRLAFGGGLLPARLCLLTDGFPARYARATRVFSGRIHDLRVDVEISPLTACKWLCFDDF